MTRLERKQKFLKLLDLYYLDQRKISHISKSLNISEATAHNWFNRWVKGEMFNDIPKPKLELEDILKISKGRYL